MVRPRTQQSRPGGPTTGSAHSSSSRPHRPEGDVAEACQHPLSAVVSLDVHQQARKGSSTSARRRRRRHTRVVMRSLCLVDVWITNSVDVGSDASVVVVVVGGWEVVVHISTPRPTTTTTTHIPSHSKDFSNLVESTSTSTNERRDHTIFEKLDHHRSGRSRFVMPPAPSTAGLQPFLQSLKTDPVDYSIDDLIS